MKKQVRSSLLCLVLLGLFGLLAPGCPPPFHGSPQWVAKTYGHALLQSDAITLNRYATRENRFDVLVRNPDTAALHVIRLCEEWQDEESKTRGVTVLIGGDMHNAVRGIRLKMVKRGHGWAVSDQRMARHQDGSPLFYLRDCQISLGANKWTFDTNLPDPRKLRQPLQPGVPGSGFVDLRPGPTPPQPEGEKQGLGPGPRDGIW